MQHTCARNDAAVAVVITVVMVLTAGVIVTVTVGVIAAVTAGVVIVTVGVVL